MTVMFRRLATVAMSYRSPGARDGQGNYTYGAATSFAGRPRQQNEVVQQSDGESVNLSLRVLVRSTESNIPSRNDRVTYNSDEFIVVSRSEAKSVSGVIEGYWLDCRDA